MNVETKRKLLVAIVWVTSLGGVIQLLIIASASWISLSGAYSVSELSMGVFITQYVPWLLWLKTIVVEVLGGFGYWLLGLPILFLSLFKFTTGTAIGLWAYFVLKDMAAELDTT